jgi:hypothetical protein
MLLQFPIKSYMIVGCILSLILQLCFSPTTLAQRVTKGKMERSPIQRLIYADQDYLSSIKSVQVIPAKQEGAFPILPLGGDDVFEVSFDDLRADIRQLYFGIEFCDAQWNPSLLSPLEYAKGFNESRIQNVQTSNNTLQPYTQYRFQFPNAQVSPLLPGNYLLKVYEDADKRRLLWTRKIYFYKPQLQIDVDLSVHSEITKMAKQQKLDIRVTGGQSLQVDPYRDLQLLVMQNQRSDRLQMLSRPQQVSHERWDFNAPQTLIFSGSTEFRYLDLRSLKLASQQIKEIQQDNGWKIQLHEDSPIQDSYAHTPDHNGQFYLLQNDVHHDPLASDYAEVTFRLQHVPQNYQSIYVVGAFNGYKRNEENRMQYDSLSQTWFWKTYLKQGVYDYTYVHANDVSDKQSLSIDKDYRETSNQYQVLLYLRRPGTTWDELLGFTQWSTTSLSLGIPSLR